MAEKVSKPKAPAKPKKAAAPKTSDGAEISAAAAPSKAKTSKTSAPVDHSDVAKLAHHYFTQRGHKHGHHEDDWFRAEEELRGKAS